VTVRKRIPRNFLPMLTSPSLTKRCVTTSTRLWFCRRRLKRNNRLRCPAQISLWAEKVYW